MNKINLLRKFDKSISSLYTSNLTILARHLYPIYNQISPPLSVCLSLDIYNTTKMIKLIDNQTK